jgi:PKD repeat protein
MFRTCLSFLIMIVVITGGALAADSLEPRPFAPVQEGFTASASLELPYAPDRLLVQFTDKAMDRISVGTEKGARVAGNLTGLEQVDALAAAAGLRLIERPYLPARDAVKAAAFGQDRWLMFHFDRAQDLPGLAEALRQDRNVEQVSLDWRAFPAAVPNDPVYSDQWGHNNTGQMLSYDWSTNSHENGSPVGTPGFDGHAEEAWDKSQGYGDSGVIIAILDSGVDVDHPDLRLVAGYDFGDNDSNPDDNSASPGHGTACAGVAAAIAGNNRGVAGIAGGASVMPCKVADSGGSMYFSYIQNALYWAADNGADVISMSLGAAISSDPATDAALSYAYNAGCVILAATGNENNSTISYPAIHQSVMGIGAASPCGDRKRSSSSRFEVNPGVSTDSNGYTCDGERWWGSNYGSTTQDDRGAVDIIAPTILPTTDIGGGGGYDPGDYDMWFNGTSCATPYAAGVAALVISANPTFTSAQVWDAMTSTATDVVNVESGAGWDRYSGYGMVNADAAVGGSAGPVAPTADFAGSPTSGTFPLTVVFTDLSSGAPDSWAWDFGDFGASAEQNPSHTYTAAGTYTVSLTATNAQGSDTATRTGYITVTEPGVTTFITAGSESSVSGTVESGSFASTTVSDGVSEAIREELYTGHPRKRYSFAEHHWNFDLPAGGAATFHLEASRADNGEGDNFLFAYSTDGVNWTALATVSSASEQTFSVALGNLSGAVTVRATDTDRNWGNEALDVLYVDYMAFELGDVQPVAPTADFAADPTSGTFPLTVVFTDLSSGAPDSWAWDFGDFGASAEQNPSHTYTAAGTYTVSLTATNAQGSDTATRTGYITVTEPGTGSTTMHVAGMAVGRIKSGPNYYGTCTVTVVDGDGLPVAGAMVSASYDGPSSGAVSGATGSNGAVTLQGSGMKRPSGEWCFEVTGIALAGLTYDAAANAVTLACESGAVNNADGQRALPAEVALGQNHPNPFNPVTTIKYSLPAAGHVRLTVYNLRGQVVESLVDQTVGAGHHSVTWDARRHSSGVYFYRLETPGFSETRKMIMLK